MEDSIKNELKLFPKMSTYSEQRNYDTFCRVVRPMKGIENKRRELGMAYQLQQPAKSYKKIFCLCGMAHLSDVRTAFDTPQAVPLDKVKRFAKISSSSAPLMPPQHIYQ